MEAFDNLRGKLLYNETQYFRQWWVWVVLFGILTLYIASLFYKYFQIIENPTVENSFMDSSTWIIFIVLLSVVGLMWLSRLEVSVYSNGLYSRFFPLKGKFRKWEQIRSMEMRAYQPLQEYGGWGIRGLGGDYALNISGNQGLQLVLANGDRLLLGTQNPKELGAVLKSIPEIKDKLIWNAKRKRP